MLENAGGGDGAWRDGWRNDFQETLNAKDLEALGAERLAELLVEVSTGNAGVKRRVRLELASLQSPDQVAKEIRKRLSTIARLDPSLTGRIEGTWSTTSKHSVVQSSSRSPRPILPKAST